MTEYFPSEGSIKEGGFPSILYNIYKSSISGLMIVETEKFEKKIMVEDKKIVFAVSNLKDDFLGNFLLKNGIIDKETLNETNSYMKRNKKRFGRSLLELGHLDYDQVWMWIQKHLKKIVFSLFESKRGKYRILVDCDKSVENIILDMDIVSMIVEGMRDFRQKRYLSKKFKDIKCLYINKAAILPISQMNLKPYEVHVLDLLKREPDVEKILDTSELLEYDTMRILYLFLILEIVTTEKADKKPVLQDMEENVMSPSTFKSFEEALKYYNMKYEMIYKILSKEIGPISLSVLIKAVEDIVENLPSYLQKVKFRSNGCLNEDVVLKSVWYHDFDENIGEFLRGLEEILYAEMYVVKKHLGVEYEQQILKWIKGTGN